MISYQKASIAQIDVNARVVLLRVDFNVPLQNGQISDDARIIASLPTIRDLLNRGAKQIVLLSHLGRPIGRDEALSLKPIRERLANLLAMPVGFSEATLNFQSSERVVLCENLRFWPGEAKNDLAFAQELVSATGADLFVQDGFSVCHRSTATTDAITRLLPSYASAALIREYQAVGGFFNQAKSPIVAIIGGAKISDKLALLKQMIKRADQIFVGGALANTLLLAQGKPVGSSLVEYDQESEIESIKQLLLAENKKLFLPNDVVVADDKMALGGQNKVLDAVLGSDKILDIGSSSQMILSQLIANAGAVIWNGTMGYAENPAFAMGSETIIKALLASRPQAVIGGGDTLAFINQNQPNLKYDKLFISTGGGAMLDLLSRGRLVGIDCLLDA